MRSKISPRRCPTVESIHEGQNGLRYSFQATMSNLKNTEHIKRRKFRLTVDSEPSFKKNVQNPPDMLN